MFQKKSRGWDSTYRVAKMFFFCFPLVNSFIFLGKKIENEKL